MNEHISSPESLPHLTVNGQGFELIGSRLAVLLTEYMDGLENERRSEHRQKSVSDKIDAACWEWAMQHGTFDKAVELRSLQSVRTLVLAASDPDTTAMRDFPVPVSDPFWRQVDERMYDHLADMTAQEVHNRLPPLEQMPFDQIKPLCTIDAHTLTRAADSDRILVHYRVIPMTNYLAQA